MLTELFFASDGKTLFGIETNRLVVWDVPHRRLRCVCPGSLIGISRDGTRCLTAAERLSAADLRTGSTLSPASLAPSLFDYHQRVSISRSGDSALLVHDVLGGQPTKRIAVSERLDVHHPLIKTPQDRYILVKGWYDIGIAEGERLLCYDVETGKEICSSAGHLNSAFRLFASQAQQIVVILEDSRCCFYDSSTGHQITQFESRKTHIAIQFDQGGERYIDTYTREYLDRLPSPITSVSLDPTKRLRVAVAAGTEIEVINQQASDSAARSTNYEQRHRGTVLPERLKIDGFLHEAEAVVAVAFHPDGEQVAYLLESGTLRLWHITTNAITPQFERS